MHKALCSIICICSTAAIGQAIVFAIGYDTQTFRVDDWAKVFSAIFISVRCIGTLIMFIILAYVLNRFSKSQRANLTELVEGG